ncbi:MerR family transcriptional regulator [Vallitalea sp.]|jgi:DNA-binding transcriptional MerR regulator|uniref:MerR family transcriptional regulator n=1 Tax=Vallitalea sp. TaxID=1882829 RepID=UPI0025F5C193|nr:MerR family transcriptional regulator [Vallitalea sp.]MCT4686119.1 MerR family transcriptional regulator [Vallitalea sp.]
MNTKFSIGEMAKLHNISIKALRYYDEIGLFKPIEVNKDSGYRYYSHEQFEQLNTIKYLKYLGVPLKDIKNYLEIRDIDYYLEMLHKEKDIVTEKIKVLEKITKRLNNQIQEINQVKTINNIGIVHIKDIPERKIISLKEEINSNLELELSLRKLENLTKKRLPIVIGRVGVTLSMDNVNNHNYGNYNSVFILLEEDVESDMIATLKYGKYASIYYRGCDHKESPKYYKMIHEYLKINSYKISGDSIERVIINEYKSNNTHDYLTEIQVPVVHL